MRGKGLLAGALATAMLAATLAAGAAEQKTDLDVVVTIKPIHSLVSQLMEGVGTPTLLVEGAASPHSFALKPSGARAVNSADVFIRVSEDLEPFTGRIVKALPETVQLVTLANAPGVKLLDRRTSGTFKPHPTGKHETHDPTAAGGDEDGEHLGGSDGHIWLDPDNAKAIVAHLAKILSARAPAAAPQIQANARQLESRLDALAAEIATKTRPLQGRPYVVFHDAYQYFEKRFDLDAIGSVTVGGPAQPSAKRLTELRERIRALRATCVFAEPMFQPKLVAAVIEGTDARSGVLDPLGATLEPGPDQYFTLMRNLAASLESCLAAQ